MAKITEDLVRAIRSEYKPKIVMAKHLAEKYNLKVGHVKEIVQNRTWAHVK
jgi:hypothetical protein